MSLKYDFLHRFWHQEAHTCCYSLYVLDVLILMKSILEQLGYALEQRGFRPPSERTHHLHLSATHSTIAQTSERLARKGKLLDIQQFRTSISHKPKSTRSWYYVAYDLMLIVRLYYRSFIFRPNRTNVYSHSRPLS